MKQKKQRWPKCGKCGVRHSPQDPHKLSSLIYRLAFTKEHGREPTWHDAMRHCAQPVKDRWMAGLISQGVTLGPDAEVRIEDHTRRGDPCSICGMSPHAIRAHGFEGCGCGPRRALEGNRAGMSGAARQHPAEMLENGWKFYEAKAEPLRGDDPALQTEN